MAPVPAIGCGHLYSLSFVVDSTSVVSSGVVSKRTRPTIHVRLSLHLWLQSTSLEKVSSKITAIGFDGVAFNA